MMKACKIHKVIFILGFIIFLFSIQSFGQNKEISNKEIFTNMFTAIKNVKTLRANITSYERIGDHITHTRYAVKLNISPYKSYSKDLDKGVEILYNEGENGNEAIVNPNGFPYVNVH